MKRNKIIEEIEDILFNGQFDKSSKQDILDNLSELLKQIEEDSEAKK